MSGSIPFETLRDEIVAYLTEYRAQIIREAGGEVIYDREGKPSFPKESIGNSFKRMIGYRSGKDGLIRANALLNGQNNLTNANDLGTFLAIFNRVDWYTSKTLTQYLLPKILDALPLYRAQKKELIAETARLAGLKGVFLNSISRTIANNPDKQLAMLATTTVFDNSIRDAQREDHRLRTLMGPRNW